MDDNVLENQSVPDDIEDRQEPEPNRGTLRTCVNCGCENYELDQFDKTQTVIKFPPLHQES